MSVFIQRAPQLRSVNAALADTLPQPFSQPDPQPDFDDEDTQPSLGFPSEDDFSDAPTIPGFTLRADGSVIRERHELGEGQWDRVLRAVAIAVKRVFASHSIKGLS
jgi:hypothetical protein